MIVCSLLAQLLRRQWHQTRFFVRFLSRTVSHTVSRWIIQGVRTEACKLIFGNTDKNVGYAHFVKEDLQKAGHFVELSFTLRKATMRNLDKINIANKVLHWKDYHQMKEKSSLWSGIRSTRTNPFHNWGVRPIRIAYSLWMEYSLLHPLWKEQSLIFRKCSWLMHAIYTLESIRYFCVMVWQWILIQVMLLLQFFLETKTRACGDSFGRTILNYILYINSGEITIITDQDKGQMNAISEYLWPVGHFHCSYHHRQNIIKMCGGGGGKVPNSALWMYNKLMRCRSVAPIDHNKSKHFKNMKNKDIQYLNYLWINNSIWQLDAPWVRMFTCIIICCQEQWS